jgi:hypothetical protein
MRKPRRISLTKETLRDLERRLIVAGATAATVCVCPDIGQHTCAYSNCASCAHP